MADSFTKVTNTSFLPRIKNAFFGVIFGLALFVGSFYVLFTNEGRVDLSLIAEQSIEMTGSGDFDGEFVSYSGNINTEEAIGDDMFLNAGDYVYLQRVVEMYSWKEIEDTDTTESYGGSSTTTTTYTYEQGWDESPSTSSNFEVSEGHENPEKKIDSSVNKVIEASIGEYSFSLSGLRLPRGKSLDLDDEMLVPTKTDLAEIVLETEIVSSDIPENETLQEKIARKNAEKQREKQKMEEQRMRQEEEANKNTAPYDYIREGNTLFIGDGTLTTPVIGDLRITYNVIHSDSFATIFGKIQGQEVIKYDHDEESSIYHLFDSPRVAAIETLHGEFLMMLWLMRGAGFLMMWIGLQLILGVITTFLSILPPLARFGRAISGIVTFAAALVLSLITIFVGMIFYNIYILVVAIALCIGVAIFYFMRKKKKSQDTRNTTQKSGLFSDESKFQKENVDDLFSTKTHGDDDGDLIQPSGNKYDKEKINDLLGNKEEEVTQSVEQKFQNGERKINNINRATDEGIIQSGSQVEKYNDKNISDDDIFGLLNDIKNKK